jgi:hypothetical protein
VFLRRFGFGGRMKRVADFKSPGLDLVPSTDVSKGDNWAQQQAGFTLPISLPTLFQKGSQLVAIVNPAKAQAGR